MMKKFALLTFLVVFISASIFAQEDKKEKLKDKDVLAKYENGWTVSTGLGLDMGQLVFINPRASAGQDKLGFGGLINTAATYRKDRFVWDNAGALELGFTRFGKRNKITGNPFQKTSDVLRLATKPAYAITSDYKWYVATEAMLESQLMKSYRVGDFILASGDQQNLISRFLSPGDFRLLPGIEYKPDDHFFVLLSPASLRLLIVADDYLADTFEGALGNPWRAPGDFDNVDFQLGAAVKAGYKNSFAKDRILLNSSLYLFYNYLGGKDGGKNLPVVQWLTALDFKIFDGLSAGIATALDYDFNQKVSQDWNPDTGTFNKVEQSGAQFKEAIYIKYTKIFTPKKKGE